MKKKNLRKVSLGLAAAMTLATLSGCSGGGNSAKETEKPTEKAAAETTQAAGGDATEAPAEAEATTYPLQTDETLVYWGPLNSNVSANFTNLGDTEIGKQWQEQVGVKIEFQHPTTGQDKEQFNLIVADGNYPDLWDYNWLDANVYPGGAAKAIEDGIILELNDLFDKYCPNIKAYLAANPDMDQAIKTDDGKYFAFPAIRESDNLCTSMGPMMRADWLKECGLEAPETVDEWHTALTAFKDKMGAVAPFTWNNTQYVMDIPIAYAYNTPKQFIIDDGKVVYGPAKQEYKDYLKTMNQWYKEGLIDQDVFSTGDDQTMAKMTSGRSGATVAWCGSGLQNYTTTGRTSDPNYELVGLKWPVLNKGDKPENGHIDNRYYYGGIAIGATCKNPELAAKVLDYGYGEEGHMMFNFGKEGVSYNMVDGYPTYTDEILNNPDGWSIAQAMAKHIMACYQGPMIQDIAYQDQYFQLPEAKAAVKNWADSNARAHKLPTITPSQEESSEFASIMNDIGTYVDEMTSKFILGTEDIDAKFDDYISTINKMGLDRAVEIEQAAYERYQQR